MGDGAKLKKVLDIQGRNIREISKKIGLTPTTLYSIVKRDGAIKAEFAIKLADELNISPKVICSKFPSELEEAMSMIKKTVIKGPVTVGDTVYYFYIEDFRNGDPPQYNIVKTKVTDIWAERGFTLACFGEDNEIFLHKSWDDIGEKVFLTREEALDFIENNYDFPYDIMYKEE